MAVIARVVAAATFVELIAGAGLDQRRAPAGANEQAVEAERDLVSLVQLGGVALPEQLGHKAEHRARVDPDGPVANHLDLDVADSIEPWAWEGILHVPA